MPLVIEGHDLEWRGEGGYTIQSAHKGAGFGYWPSCGRYANTRGCSTTWGLDPRTSRGDCLIGSQGSWVASFVGAHVSLEGRARFGTCLGKRSNGGSRSEGEQLLMRLLQTQQEQMGQLQALLERSQGPLWPTREARRHT